MIRLFLQSETYLPDAKVQPLLEIDKRVLAPDRKPNLLACHQRTAMIEQKRKHPRRLLLQAHRRALPAQFHCEIMFDGYHTLSSGEPRVSAKEDSVFKRTLQLSLAAWLTTGALWAASDPFVGKWKLDPSQSKETDQMKIEVAGPNRYVFDFGAGGKIGRAHV